MIGLLKFVLEVHFLMGLLIGSLLAYFVLPLIWKPKK